MIEIVIGEENRCKVIESISLKQPTEKDKELLRSSVVILLSKLGDTAKHIKKIAVNFWQFGVWEYLDSNFTVILKSGKRKKFIGVLAENNPFEIGGKLASEISGFIDNSN